MIIELKNNTDSKQSEDFAAAHEGIRLFYNERLLVVTPSSMKQTKPQFDSIIEKSWLMDSDIQLASRKFQAETRNIKIGNYTSGMAQTLLTIGPCGVESEEMIEQTAQLIIETGLTSIRAGAFKPRTSPYSFQGMGEDGLKLLAKMRDKYGLSVVTEVRDSTHIDMIIDYTDVVQIGAKAMYDHGILRACGQSQKPILIKRGFGTTLQEFVQAAEFVLSGGNPNVMLCERGIRTFETKSRFTLDLCGVAYLKENTNLPVILDPSHAMGYSYGVPDLARACMAMGVDGLLIEVHPNPMLAKSDAAQQLTHNQFRALFETLKPIANAVGRSII
ncbi:MAG: 3-deoxy-7-phosphoheptulonate synthase [Bacteroidetes bacterium HGW-Bacteroidetes-6]|jgi:3-deoxy-7-phosphoheptulonate synthase|nr:MAG: 3-deoxy-7-phosphoheptulonate synthase [Bacteroidetes bacterium HGW-Bacteroidetes-6]